MKRLLVVAMFACGVVLSLADFQQQVNDAKACDAAAGDTCRNAGASRCLCATPVNASKAAANQVAASVSCGNAQVECARLNPRCVNGTCVADIQ